MPSGFLGSAFLASLDDDALIRVAEFFNDALGQAAQPLIVIPDDFPTTDITDTSEGGRLCNTWFEKLLRATLRDHLWNFAIARAELEENDPPENEWTNSFDLPDDCVRVVQLGAYPENQPRWVIEGRRLLTNESTATIKYIGLVVDPALWDELFYQTMATRLAAKIAMPITKDVKFVNLLMQHYFALLADAKVVDGQESNDTDRQDVDDLIFGRDV